MDTEKRGFAIMPTVVAVIIWFLLGFAVGRWVPATLVRAVNYDSGFIAGYEAGKALYFRGERGKEVWDKYYQPPGKKAPTGAGGE